MSSLLWKTVLTLLLNSHYMVTGRETGFEICVMSRQGIKDLSYQNLTRIPLNLPKYIEYLDVSGNKILQMEGVPFVGLHNLCFLKATFCGLKRIAPNAFDHTPGIKVLNISHNSLFVIPDLSLPAQLKILDLSRNLYKSCRLPKTFQNLTNLTFLALGSNNVISVKINDFDCLRNKSLKHLTLETGTKWQRYDSGSLARLKSLEDIRLTVSYCEQADIYNSILVDLNETQTARITLVQLLSQHCNVSGDPFENLKSMKFIRNLTIVDTWIDSSVMINLTEDVLLSKIQQVAFVNITYNENTPEGFEVPSINHTRNLQSVIVNGVHHYQYKYPTINLSLDNLSNVTYLKFSGTGLNISPCNLISDLPSLETLDVSDNLLDDTGFWWPSCSFTSSFLKLTHLSLAHNRFVNLALISAQTHQMKALQSLDLSFNSIQIDDECSWPAHLTHLSLRHNNLGDDVFLCLSPHFEWVDLSKTGITVITREALLLFPKLKHLLLSYNSIKVLPVNLHAPALLTLHVNGNAITSISKENFQALPKLQTLKAGNNPFSCTCDSYWLVNFLNKSLLSDWPLDYVCSFPPSLTGLPLVMYVPGEVSCQSWLQATIAIPVTFGIIGILGLTFYVCDGVWYTKMLWVWIRVKRRNRKKADRLKDVSFRYHAFLSYSNKDSTWVDSQLVPSLEGAGLSLCIHERDFIPGEWIMDNIINSMEASYKTLFVLSKSFVQSEWCNYELVFAQHKEISVQQDSLVFILLEPIPLDSLPKKFLKLQTLLRKQTYLEWPKDERKRHFFWSSIKSMLQSGDRNMVLKDVAEDIADTLALLTDEV